MEMRPEIFLSAHLTRRAANRKIAAIRFPWPPRDRSVNQSAFPCIAFHAIHEGARIDLMLDHLPQNYGIPTFQLVTRYQFRRGEQMDVRPRMLFQVFPARLDREFAPVRAREIQVRE